jgi:cytochrome c oxidase assembly factor CtaG
VAGTLTAGAYTGPPELTVSQAFTSWTLDLPVLVVVLVAVGLYLAGVWRVRKAGQPWPAARTVAFLAGGTGALVVATMSFLGVYQGVLFWSRAVQNVLLLLVAPLFLTLGRPLSLLIAARPRLGSRAEAMVRSRAARILTFPAITALVLVIVPFVLYFTPWYEAGLRNDAVRELTYLALLAPGVVFFWTLLRVDPVPKEYPYLVSLWVTGAEVVGDAVLGLAIIADQHLIAGSYYQALGRPWGPTLRADQVIGGGALWILGDIVGLPFLAAMLIQMIREDEQEAATVDAELDAAEQRAAARAAASGEDAAPGQDAGEDAAPGEGAAGAELARAAAEGRPWWESDPRFTGRFHGPESG